MFKIFISHKGIITFSSNHQDPSPSASTSPAAPSSSPPSPSPPPPPFSSHPPSKPHPLLLPLPPHHTNPYDPNSPTALPAPRRALRNTPLCSSHVHVYSSAQRCAPSPRGVRIHRRAFLRRAEEHLHRHRLCDLILRAVVLRAFDHLRQLL